MIHFIRGKTKGITLVEVVGSIVIIAYCLVGLLALYTVGMVRNKIAIHKVSASFLAQAKIEELKFLDYNLIDLNDYPQFDIVKIDRGASPGDSDDLEAYRVTEVVADPVGIKIIVSVSWMDYQAVLNEVLETTVAAPF